MNPSFNPFDTRLDELTAADLARLSSVAEGWYVEYKSATLPVKKLAKSLSSFANQYGGWLFVGVAGDSTTLRAASFPGIHLDEVPTVVEALRNASKDVVNPEVFYETAVITGPAAKVSLSADRAVVIARVPQGPEPPYIHSDGRVYRRVADASDPKPEADRAILDRLWDRAEKSRARLASFVTRSPVVSQAESERAFLHLSIFSDPYELGGHQFKTDYATLASKMSGDPIPFDTVFSSATGFVARQTAGNDPYFRSLTWELDVHGHSFVTLPFNHYEIPYADALDDYGSTAKFNNLIAAANLETGRVVDLNILFDALMGIFQRHRELLSDSGERGPFYVKTRLENVWRVIPFLDMPSFVTHVQKHGVPIVQEEHILAPPGTELSTFVVLPPTSDPIDEQVTSDVVAVAIPILESLGIPRELLMPSTSTLEFVQTGSKFREAQTRRNARSS